MPDDNPRNFFLPPNAKAENFIIKNTEHPTVKGVGFEYTGKYFFHVSREKVAHVNFYKLEESDLDSNQLMHNKPFSVIQKTLSFNLKFEQDTIKRKIAFFDSTSNQFYYFIERTEELEGQISRTIDVHVIDIGDVDKYRESYNEIMIDNSKRGDLALTLKGHEPYIRTKFYFSKDRGRKFLIVLNVGDHISNIQCLTINVVEIVGKELNHLYHAENVFHNSTCQVDDFRIDDIHDAVFNADENIVYIFMDFILFIPEPSIYEVDVSKAVLKHIYTWENNGDIVHPFLHYTSDLVLIITHGYATIWKIINGEKVGVKKVCLRENPAEKMFFHNFSLRKPLNKAILCMTAYKTETVTLLDLSKETRFATFPSKLQFKTKIICLNWNMQEVALCVLNQEKRNSISVEIRRLENGNIPSLQELSRLAILTTYPKNILKGSNIPLVLKRYLDVV